MRDRFSMWYPAGPVILLVVLSTTLALASTGEIPRYLSSHRPSAAATVLQSGQYVGGDTCFACHDIQSQFEKNPHYKNWDDPEKPWSEKGCESCHGPGQAHIEGGGDIEQIFRFSNGDAQDRSEKCLNCHLESSIEQADFLRSEHSLNSVACTSCHTIHAPQTQQNQLRAASPALCYDCHGEVRAQFKKPFHHRVEEGLMKCESCHSPHGTYKARQLQAATGADMACFTCHADKQGPFVYEHLAVQVEGCAVCHDPHGSSNPKLLKRSEIRQLCLECHSGSSGIPGPAAPGFHNITNIEYQNCTSCHVEIHGSNLHPFFFE